MMIKLIDRLKVRCISVPALWGGAALRSLQLVSVEATLERSFNHQRDRHFFPRQVDDVTRPNSFYRALAYVSELSDVLAASDFLTVEVWTARSTSAARQALLDNRS